MSVVFDRYVNQYTYLIIYWFIIHTQTIPFFIDTIQARFLFCDYIICNLAEFEQFIHIPKAQSSQDHNYEHHFSEDIK